MRRKIILYLSIILPLFILLFCPPLLEKAASLFSSLRAPSKEDSFSTDREGAPSRRQDSALGSQVEELTALMRERYGNDVTLESLEFSQGSLCTFRKEVTAPAEGEFYFQAECAANPEDNYLQELLHFLGDSYPCSNMSLQWEETGTGLSKKYTPVFVLSSWGGFSLNSYCEDICNFLEYCMKNVDFAQNTGLISSFTLSFAGQETDYSPVSLDSYQRIAFYNELYAFVDTFAVSVLNSTDAGENETTSDTDLMPLSPHTAEYYLGLTPACTFSTSQGTEYRMVGVDRAAGSSYYSLIAAVDNGKTCILVNGDPYNGSGGEAKWLTFLDEDLGFSCLAYSGGAYGSLYRTEDGGRTFTCVEYPSARALLPDGTYYQPFVMPEKVYEEDGQLFLVAGQGPEGDYYGEDGWCGGLYRSEDLGKSWIYVKEIPVEDTRL